MMFASSFECGHEKSGGHRVMNRRYGLGRKSPVAFEAGTGRVLTGLALFRLVIDRQCFSDRRHCQRGDLQEHDSKKHHG